MIKLAANQADRAKSLLLDFCICAGISPNTRSDAYARNKYSVINTDSYYAKYYKPAIQNIMNAISRRTFNFREVETAIHTIRYYNAQFGETASSNECSWQVRKEETVAKYLAWACQENKIYWNDLGYTEEERADLRDRYYFAKALADADCFVSQPAPVVKTRATKVVTVDDSGAPVEKSEGPKSGYKSAGPQSAYVAGLVSKPGEQEFVSGVSIYCILGDKAGTIVPQAFIHPVNNPDAGQTARVNSEGKPIIRFGAGNGYTDLMIYSQDYTQLENIIELLRARGGLEKYTGVHVATVKNKGKYYRVNTEAGEVFIRPTKLNEKLLSETFEAMKADKEKELLVEETDDTLVEAAGDPVTIINIEQFARDMAMYD